MDARENLAGTVKRLSSLADMASAPARRAATAMPSEASRLKAARSSAKRAFREAERASANFSWIPLFGRSFHARRDAAARGFADADAALANLRSRARDAKEAIDTANAARASLRHCISLLQSPGPLHPVLASRISAVSARTGFLASTEGKHGRDTVSLGKRTLELALEAEGIAAAWAGAPRLPAPPRPEVPPPTARSVPTHNVGAKATGSGKVQLALDFDGTGQVEEEPRVWLPVSVSRRKEMIALGARQDTDAPRRGSQLWIPVSARHAFERFLPLAFRQEPTRFSFPPIAAKAERHNLWSVFDQPSWNHVRSTVYDRSGHRCQICGKQGGSLWSRVASPQERASGRLVECHEVWEWEVPDRSSGVGIQRLKRLLCVCPDCHMIFHSGRTMHLARAAGVAAEAEEYIKVKRMMVNRTDGATLASQVASDRAEWEANKSVDTWIMDLSHLAAQDFMADHQLVLKEGNAANVVASQIAGIEFATEDGATHPAVPASALASGTAPQSNGRGYGG